MTTDELLIKMHTYTKIEQYLKDHRDIRHDQSMIDEFNHQLSDSEAAQMLVPIIYGDTNPGPRTFPASYFFNDQDVLKVKITQHTRYSTPILHNHDFYEMFYVYEGEFTQHINQQDFTMHTGDICLIQPGVYHSLDVNNYSIVLNILIDQKTFEAIFFNDLVGDSAFSTFFRTDFFSEKLKSFIIFKTHGEPATRDYVLKMYLETLNRPTYYAQVVHSYLLLLFSHLLRHFSNDALIPKPHRKQDLLDYQIISAIQTDYQTITLSQLAEQFHYSTQYLSQRIKHVTGHSFSQFLLQRRMQIAEELLKTTTKKIKEISQMIGYPNQENFIRTFKREHDATPTQYRQDHQTFTTSK